MRKWYLVSHKEVYICYCVNASTENKIKGCILYYQGVTCLSFFNYYILDSARCALPQMVIVKKLFDNLNTFETIQWCTLFKLT